MFWALLAVEPTESWALVATNAAIVLALASLLYRAGRIAERFDRISERVSILEAQVQHNTLRLGALITEHSLFHGAGHVGPVEGQRKTPSEERGG